MRVGGAGGGSGSAPMARPGTLWSSVLTLILLVVLGGGAGLLAVSLSDHRAPWAPRERPDPPSLRPYPPQDTSPQASEDPATDPSAGEPRELTATVVRQPEPPAEWTRQGYRRASASPARTAVEGPYHEVAEAPWWRRLLSLALIVVIVAVVGAGIAVIMGAAIAALAELLDGAIG